MNIIDLNNFRSSKGEKLNEDDQKKLEALLRDTNKETWDEAMDVMIDGHRGYLWKWVNYVISSEVLGYQVMRENCPPNVEIRAAMILAQESIKRGHALIGFRIEPIA